MRFRGRVESTTGVEVLREKIWKGRLAKREDADEISAGSVPSVAAEIETRPSVRSYYSG